MKKFASFALVFYLIAPAVLAQPSPRIENGQIKLNSIHVRSDLISNSTISRADFFRGYFSFQKKEIQNLEEKLEEELERTQISVTDADRARLRRLLSIFSRKIESACESEGAEQSFCEAEKEKLQQYQSRVELLTTNESEKNEQQQKP